MYQLYPFLVEACINFKIHAGELVAKHEGKFVCLTLGSGKQFVVTQEMETVSLADGYRIEHRNGAYYCLKGDETGKLTSSCSFVN